MVKLRALTPLLLIMIVTAVCGVAVLGYIIWQGNRLVDQTPELEQQVVEFLKTTDVRYVWDGTVKIKESYDHKPGGKVAIVEYTTVDTGHPQFVLTAFEDHTAVITVNQEGEVVSAFCVHGNVQEIRIWDLINQRWISRNP